LSKTAVVWIFKRPPKKPVGQPINARNPGFSRNRLCQFPALAAMNFARIAGPWTQARKISVVFPAIAQKKVYLKNRKFFWGPGSIDVRPLWKVRIIDEMFPSRWFSNQSKSPCAPPITRVPLVFGLFLSRVNGGGSQTSRQFTNGPQKGREVFPHRKNWPVGRG